MGQNYFKIFRFLIFLFSLPLSVYANNDPILLNPTGWTITGLNIGTISNFTDNDPATKTTLHNNGSTPASFTIDMKQTNVLERIYLTGPTIQTRTWPDNYNNRLQLPMGVIMAYVGDSPTTTNKVADYVLPYDSGSPIDVEVEFRFQPTSGRYVRLELQTAVDYSKYDQWQWAYVSTGTDISWNVGEIELSGFTGANALVKEDAVVLSNNTAPALVLAANDLSYYLGKLTKKPVPVINPNQTGNYSGNLYTIVDLKSYAPDYNTMIANAANLPDGVNVERQGRQILFKAWPYQNVLKSVWEFLHRQGVCWVYPDGHGDYVPSVSAVDLSILPLTFKHSSKSISANWPISAFESWPVWYGQTIRQEYLNLWRNGWDSSWNTPDFFSDQEVPLKGPDPVGTLDSDYSEEFIGSPHNFSSVVPTRILLQHPDWWGYSSAIGQRVSPDQSGAPAFDQSNTDLIQWVANKMVAVGTYHPLIPKFIMVPMDATSFCEDTGCNLLNSPSDPSPVPWVWPRSDSLSGAYFNFVNEVAKQVKLQNSTVHVGALAYSDYWNPPQHIPLLSDNVDVQVCQYGSPNLPMNSPVNAAFKAGLELWKSKCPRLTTYDYALLHTDYWQQDPQVPVAMVAGIVDHAKYLDSLGALDGSVQATLESFPYDPWNYYAYPRIRVNLNQTAAQLEDEFFRGYYWEASPQMLAYYKAMEDYQFANNVDVHYKGYCYGVPIGGYPLGMLSSMKSAISTAESTATSWVVKYRLGKIREQFNWVVHTSGNDGVNFDDTSDYQVVGKDFNPVPLDMAKGTLPPPVSATDWNYVSVSTADVHHVFWQYWAYGRAYERLYWMQGGRYEIKITANSSSYNTNAWPYWPTLDLIVGPQVFANIITSTVSLADTDYIYDVDVPDGFGVQDLYLRCPYGGGNIYVSTIVVTLLEQWDPILFNIQVSAVTSSSAKFTWTSDKLSDSTVDYGFTTSYGASSTLPALTTSHEIDLANLTPNSLYHFRVKSKDVSGNQAASSDQTFITVVGGGGGNPSGANNILPFVNVFKPLQDPLLRLCYQLANNSHMTITIYNRRGDKIKELENADKVPGTYCLTWDGHNESGSLVASGPYLINFDFGSEKQTKKIVVLK